MIVIGGVGDFHCEGEGSTEQRTLLGTPDREPQEYSRNIVEYKDPGRCIPIIYLLYSWSSRFGVPSRVPLLVGMVLSDWPPSVHVSRCAGVRFMGFGFRLWVCG